MASLAENNNRQFWIAAALFIISFIISIIFSSPLFLIIPFVWIIIPFIFHYAVTFTGQLFWLMITVLPVSTELNLSPSLGLDFPDEILLMLLTGVFIIKLIHQPSLFPPALIRHPLFLILILHLVWIMITCFFSVDPLLAVKYFLAKTWYVIPFVVLPQLIVNSKTGFKNIAFCLVIPMVLIVLQSLIRHSFYLFSFEGIKKTLSPFFRNHVNYSAMLVCILAILWCLKKLTPQKSVYSKWIITAIVIGITGLIFSYSRGAWIALVFGIAGGAIIHKKILKQALIIIAVLGMGTLAWLIRDNHYLKFIPDFQHTIFHTNFSDHLAATVTLKDVSDAERFYRWVAGVKMVIAKPITGFGPNNFYDNYKGYAANSFKTWVSNNPDHSSVHNYFLLTALEQGMAGLILFTALFTGMLLYTQKLYHQLHSYFYRMVALTTGIILVMIGTVNFLSDLIETDKIGSLFWLCLGVIILLTEKLKEEKQSIARSGFPFYI